MKAVLIRCWVVALLSCAGATASHANWLDELREMVPYGKPSMPADQLSVAAGMIAGLEVKEPALVLAAAVTGEGHWTFVNQAGQRYTTASREELARVYTNLAPDIKRRPAPVVIYLTPMSVFSHAEHLDQLPVDARLRLIAGGRSYPMRAFGRGDKRIWFAEVRTNVLVRVSDATEFEETAWQLARPLRARSMRVLALQPGAADTLRPEALRDAGGQRIDAINPEKLNSALPTLRRQTVVLTGRLEADGKLVYRTASGSERPLQLAPLRETAAEIDANLLFVNVSAPRQPGARNWLWLRVEVDGLVEALQRETLGDFFNALAGGTGQLFVEARPLGQNRVGLSVIPMRAGVLEREPGTVSALLAELVSEVVGSVLPHAVDADLVSMRRQRELDRRVVRGVPSTIQYGVALTFLIGLIGLPVALRWWGRIWAPEVAADYSDRSGFEAARAIRWLVFFLLFLPVAALPALLWGIASLPVRLLRGGRRHDKADAGTATG